MGSGRGLTPVPPLTGCGGDRGFLREVASPFLKFWSDGVTSSKSRRVSARSDSLPSAPINDSPARPQAAWNSMRSGACRPSTSDAVSSRTLSGSYPSSASDPHGLDPQVAACSRALQKPAQYSQAPRRALPAAAIPAFLQPRVRRPHHAIDDAFGQRECLTMPASDPSTVMW